MKPIKAEYYLHNSSLALEKGDKVIKKDNTPFIFSGSIHLPHVAEYIGEFDQGEKVYAILRGINESGTFEIGIIDPEELYIV